MIFVFHSMYDMDRNFPRYPIHRQLYKIRSTTYNVDHFYYCIPKGSKEISSNKIYKGIYLLQVINSDKFYKNIQVLGKMVLTSKQFTVIQVNWWYRCKVAWNSCQVNIVRSLWRWCFFEQHFFTTKKAFQPHKFILYVIEDFKSCFNVQPKKITFSWPWFELGPGPNPLGESW